MHKDNSYLQSIVNSLKGCFADFDTIVLVTKVDLKLKS